MQNILLQSDQKQSVPQKSKPKLKEELNDSAKEAETVLVKQKKQHR